MIPRIILYFYLAFILPVASFGKEEVIEIEIIIKEHKFIPDEIIVPEGKKIIITIHNQDSTIEEFESTDLKREKIIPGNSKAKIILAPLKRGEYKFIGEFNEQSARGVIIVTSETEE